MEQTSLYQRGREIMLALTNSNNPETPTHQQISDDFNRLAPGLDNIIVEFAFGQIYTREGLDLKQRALATLSSLATLGTEVQFELHVNAALTVGVESKQIVETMIHLIPYIGFPRVLNALKIIKRVFEQREIAY
ncbi:carboxymuconolactone decarboxylase family protein [Acinetobacter nosocomialis]|uniref:carboxymuconolactone decarboxylase family protein n=1 Tax=Acinetobacter calcoaceticus/baumannii complex TaxID=909768 RepID=UPI0021BF3C6A|nr:MULTISPECIES: carboxymuconolactone decarboxylase family protein [Acinetobacter calcoaceticus/baumannii complex]MCT9283956.1 carboxymuconolactone decarboxylase family protein [Acinetobacter baumannii]MCU4554531.1 carboxymuconolactone decarboxylase family protein [Acinetobacter nosocomialis]MDH2532070.1 carboxymuconolactone decarboxylase family protein [Acinetobacter baumannii]